MIPNWNLRVLVVTVIFVIHNVLQSCNCEGNTLPQVETKGAIVSPKAKSEIEFQQRPQIFPGAINAPLKRSVDLENNGENSKEFYDYYYLEPEEPECPEDEYFHIRGRKCVPYDCPGGNQYRNKFNGECLLKRYGILEDTRHRPQKMFNRLIKQSKFRLPFGLTLKG